MKEPLPKCIVVVGPTASGKSELALHLAEKWNGEIIIADARQLNKGMDIGTNKPTTAEQKRVPHHLLNITTPNKRFTAFDFQQRAFRALADITRRKKVPFLVGGTGLYVKAVIDGLDFAGTTPNPALRKKLEGMSLPALRKKLMQLDPERAKTIDDKNPRRLIRALEIVQGARFAHDTHIPQLDVLQIAPKIEREKLYARINKRVHTMMSQGLPDEVKKLSQKYAWDLPAMSGIGYREFQPYFTNTITREQLIEEIQKDTRHYAKRQLTWFRADPRIHWVKNKKEADRLVGVFLKS